LGGFIERKGEKWKKIESRQRVSDAMDDVMNAKRASGE
jgi:hypothetical protein